MGKTYHVYGIGNALVDMEFTVTPELLSTLGIDKGVMTLVDESRQTDLLAQLSEHPCKRAGGGSAANTMVALCQLGGKGFYSCKVANDEAGTFYLKDLLACGLETNLHNGDRPSGTTGKCLVLVTPDADRTMNTFLGITGEISSQEIVPAILEDSQYVYIEGYLVSSPTGKAAAIKAREIAKSAGVKISLSLSDFNMVNFFKEGLLEIIGDGVDFLFANEAEALKMADTHNINQAIAHLQTLSPAFVITRGAKGSVIFDGETTIEIDSTPVKAVDTVGAGDMYAGAFLYALTHGQNYSEAGRLASLAAARVVSRFGPRLDMEEINQIKSLVDQPLH
jgi:sugar/nucleoside kinase (ribokinase family)